MQNVQKEIEESEFEAAAGGGAVSVKVNGKREVLAINIKPEVVDPDDVEMLQDLVLTAVNDVMKQIEEKSEATMGQFTKGMNMPGMF